MNNTTQMQIYLNDPESIRCAFQRMADAIGNLEAAVRVLTAPALAGVAVHANLNVNEVRSFLLELIQRERVDSSPNPMLDSIQAQVIAYFGRSKPVLWVVDPKISE